MVWSVCVNRSIPPIINAQSGGHMQTHKCSLYGHGKAFLLLQHLEVHLLASKKSPRHSPAVKALWMGTCVAGIKWSCQCGIIQNDPEVIHWHSAYIPIAFPTGITAQYPATGRHAPHTLTESTNTDMKRRTDTNTHCQGETHTFIYTPVPTPDMRMFWDLLSEDTEPA